MSLAAARTVADAVLYEGYLLYPYRASSSKNQVRWQFGIVGPPGAAESGDGEESSMRTECLLVVHESQAAEIDVQARFLQVQVRAVERAVGVGSDRSGEEMEFEPVDELTVGAATWIRWHEAIEGVVDVGSISVEPGTERVFPVQIPAGEDHELLVDGERVVGRLVRTRFALDGQLRVRFRSAGMASTVAVSVELQNHTEWVAAAEDRAGQDKPRDVAARASFVGAHLLLAARGADFLSMTDPPDFAVEAAADCSNHRCWPVLVGEPDSHDTVLASPIILSDYPEIAEESPGDLYDSTEIDEILTLRIMTMTDEEKRAARGTDPRAAAIIDRSDNLPPEIFERLHGALRGLTANASVDQGAPTDLPDLSEIPTFGTTPWWTPAVDAAFSPESDTVPIKGITVGKGSRVRLRPSGRGDAQDIFIDGLAATVAGVYFDVDGDTHVAVVVENDPAAEFHQWYGRYSYFRPDELEPLTDSAPNGPPT
jgi:hypothetical protein